MASSEVATPGGVLSDAAIKRLVDGGELIVGGTFTESALAPASYEPRVARAGMIAPDGRPFPPDSRGPAKVVLQSGDAAMFSTVERFRMPANVAGNISVKNLLATDGLMLLSGMLIDPGYGEQSPDGKPGCCLFLHVANIGREQIVIRPELEPIARVQFLYVVGGIHPHREQIKSSKWEDQEKASLGFLTELKEVKDEVKALQARSENMVSQVHYVVVGGAIVLAVTLIGVVLAFVLAIVTK